MHKKILAFFILMFSFFAKSALAVCPVCVVAVGAGMGLCRWLGVDDAVSSIWIGALIVALGIWTTFWLAKKKLARLNAASPQFRVAKLFNWVGPFKYDKFVVSVAYYALTIVPLYSADIIGHPLNKIFGIDKIIFGSAVGVAVFCLGVWLNDFLKIKNSGKVFFPYQKVAIPVLLLILTSIIMYFTVKCY